MTIRVITAALACPLILAITSCNQASSSRSDIQEVDRSAQTSSADVKSTNVIKVLDRVRCHESMRGCPQSFINAAWNQCLSEGFVERLPSDAKAISSRDISELIQDEVTYPQTRYVEKTITDENGVVSTQSVPEVYEESGTLGAYCIGSEYLVR